MLPPHAVEAAAKARQAGDWRTAAVIARGDVNIDLGAVRQRFGTEAARAVEDDLHHLSLDLLCWHLPRHRGGMTTLQARVSAVLAPPTGADVAPLIRIRLPKSPTGPQRLQIGITTMRELANERWYVAARHTWDVRQTLGLRAAWGCSDDRPPLLNRDGRPRAAQELGVGDDRAAWSERVYRQLAAGDFIGAWQACGIDVTFTDSDALQRRSASPTCPVGLAEQVRAAAHAFRVKQVSTLFGAYVNLTVDGMTAEASDPSEYLEVPTRVATAAIPVDLALIAAGLQRPTDLHPLMRAALFPSASGSLSSVVGDRARARPAARTGAEPGSQVRVRCGDVWHRISVCEGALLLHDHDRADVLREHVLQALDGPNAGCFAVEMSWITGATRLPRGLAEQRREVKRRMQHGDTDWLLDGLARGVIDRRMRDANGWSLLHMAMWVDYERVVPMLLDAGLPVDARDRVGRTPLYLTVTHGGSTDLIRMLLDAGADPRAETVHGASPRYIARARSEWQDLGFLADL